ncbi:VWA domain-containing protein [Epilithonimonas hungarica]|uniref:Por secretion system C-terminal sorting domain-containing protein n=1 Tax=Epilithonimonas hungarica TaxID=454006 RepID=A0A1G7RAH6_9FLAO|nr:VWA domain-containing protein [Epilithonimonas hungarica]SDG07768.1 Por secretion system C-terminal sorting domain-containing protein [Epilithonimonas hungarica]
MENQDIDKMFNDAGKSAEENPTFPAFEKVWEKVEEKLDKKEQKKRIIPIWLPYGIAAGLALTFGILYFMNDDKAKIEPQIASKNYGKPINPNQSEIPKKVEEINKTFEENLVKNPIKPAEEKEIIAYHEVDSKKDKIDLEVQKKRNDEIFMQKQSVAIFDEKYIKKKDSETPPPPISKKLETSSGIAENYAYDERKVETVKAKSAYFSEVSSALEGKAAGLAISHGVRTSGSSSKSYNKDIEEVVVVGYKKTFWQKLFKKSQNKVPITEIEKELPEAGKLTAGEVNDFSKWDYWQDIAVPILDQYKNTWKFFPDRRVSVQLTNFDNNPIIGKKLKLIDDKKEVVWESVTDNRGNAELWISSLIDQKLNSQQYSIIDEDGNILSNNPKEFRTGQNLIKINESCIGKRPLDLVFVVDATGSMGDEINYLKSELLDVLEKVESNLKNTNVRYGSVFYRDNGDEYVTRKFDFSNNAENLINFIKKQDADGGGDTPEAVVEAMESSIDRLDWSNENSTKIMFLLLDAPPHLSDGNIEKLHQKIKSASEKGITIIPIAASDTDKQTEYLMRTFALLTNGTYTFLTNDSGIGNNHIKPTASEYEVEKLNDLLLRLILQRSTVPDCKNGVTKEYINKKLEIESLDKKGFSTKIYPNPTKGVFKIDANRDIEEFVLYDYTGKILLRKNNLGKGSNSFDISEYPQSVYLVRLKYGTESETFKLIKN